MTVNQDLGYLTPAEGDAFDRLIATFPDAEAGEFEPWSGTNPRPKSLLAEADEILQDDIAGFRHVPTDVRKLLADGVPEPDYLDYPYFPRGARIWCFGPAESSKTMYLQWVSARLTRAGRPVVFLSQENPPATDLDRWGRLRPDLSAFATTTCSGPRPGRP